ncbi:hypothetical protein DAPPUDRAFT_315184 [Daphnia pulex]|uniref:Peptidase C1A papain C-terminal domain-containing protein n=1 Tax=Daphnia pulex TaxID=6669 RepID=E9G901_DAPPU|nr:hypothetical protein DAPPUDRAFT_315184 [Daphnia pulex]|eukprot:EFX84062.1 hypothetical protein DAPPUDRAFT_315184 [Daphnia pulex]
MTKFTLAAVFMMLALAAGLHASDDLEVARQEYLTEEEKQRYMGAFKPVRSDEVREISSRALPTSIDYRTDSCLPPVRNQGGCGSCWAFSATTVVEFGKCKKSGGSARDFRSGVFNDANCVANNAHAMNVVGYGNLNGVDYWVVRNSWSAGWEAAGYVLVERGVDLHD